MTSDEFQIQHDAGELPERRAHAEAVVSRMQREVEAGYVIARRFPRDEDAAMRRILKACERPKLAEQAAYEFPRGKEVVSGPTIRLAEAVASAWGNIEYGQIEVEQRSGESVCLAYAVDLESNTRSVRTFTVKHMRVTKKGSYPLTDPRDIYEMVANQGSRRTRACILAVIPGDVVEEAEKACERTMQRLGGSEPLVARVQKMLAAFEERGVTQKQVEQYLGVERHAITENMMARLRRTYRAIVDGMAKPEEVFGGDAVATAEGGALRAATERLREQSAPPTPPVATTPAPAIGDTGHEPTPAELDPPQPARTRKPRKPREPAPAAPEPELPLTEVPPELPPLAPPAAPQAKGPGSVDPVPVEESAGPSVDEMIASALDENGSVRRDVISAWPQSGLTAVADCIEEERKKSGLSRAKQALIVALWTEFDRRAREARTKGGA